MATALVKIGLDVDRVVAVALDLLDEVGLDGLSTRRLAVELQVKGPALYHHFKDKNELLDQMAASMLKEALAAMPKTGNWQNWQNWLRCLGHETRAMILRHRDGARVLMTSSPTDPVRSRLVPQFSQPLIQAGFTTPEAREAASLMSCFVIGWTLNEQNPATQELMRASYDLEQAFTNSVEVIVAGLDLRRRASHGETSD